MAAGGGSMAEAGGRMAEGGGSMAEGGGSMAEPLREHNMNPNIARMPFFMLDAVTARAQRIEAELAQGVKKPFQRVVGASGDAQAMGQAPITFLRQVLACCACPELVSEAGFPPDVQRRATEILANCSGQSMGAYSVSQGLRLVRRRVAEFIERRDGYPARWQDVCLTTGASTAIMICLQLFCKDVDGLRSGVMIPVPQYPLYSATLAEYGLGQEEYYLDEAAGWALDIEELERAKSEATSTVRALVVINPGNPTAQVLTRRNMEEIIKFAYHYHLFLLADEKYQQNISADGSTFYSFKKVIREMGEPYSSGLELVSFMSASKGYAGEGGLRGGCMEIVNMDPAVQKQLYKRICAMLCPNLPGQIAVDCVARPPQPGEPSYALWLEETTAILESLKQRAKLLVNTFNSMVGIKCNDLQGCTYAFPRVALPERAVAAAGAAGQAPDEFYALSLLEQTGICVVPGSVFGQRAGSFHFRATVLPQPARLQRMLDTFKDFHDKFMASYS